MHEIEFRFWDVWNKEMYYRDLYFFEEEGIRKVPDEYSEQYVPLQYVGTKDKNGTKVYNGDILEDIHVLPGYPDLKRRWEVFWREKYCGFYLRLVGESGKAKDRQWIDLLHGGNVGDFEVIGNIYEHPQFLSMQQE